MNRKISSILKLSGILFMFMITMNFYVFVVVAMLNNGQVFVHFDYYNEGLFEYIMYFMLLPIIIFSLIKEISFYTKKHKDIKKRGDGKYQEKNIKQASKNPYLK